MENKTSDNIYELFASVLTYPNEEVRKKINYIYKLVNNNYPDASEAMTKFVEFAKTTHLWKWQEIYTRTFDVQAITTLDLGYVLFGDDYKRGEILVRLSEEHKRANNDCGNELADHLPNLLRLLNKLNNDDLKNDLIFFIIKPALQKILKEFESEKIEKKNLVYEKHHKTLIETEESDGRIYQLLIQALLEVFQQDFPNDQLKIEDSKTFTKEITNELEIQG